MATPPLGSVDVMWDDICSTCKVFYERVRRSAEVVDVDHPRGSLRRCAVGLHRGAELQIRLAAGIVDHVHLNGTVCALLDEPVAVVDAARERGAAVSDGDLFGSRMPVRMRMADDRERVGMLCHDLLGRFDAGRG